MYLDALEGQKVKLQPLTLPTAIIYLNVIRLCFGNSSAVPLCSRNNFSSYVVRWRSCTPKPKGQIVLVAAFHPEELRMICYSAFPDSMSATIGDCSFAFRFRGDKALPLLYAALPRS